MDTKLFAIRGATCAQNTKESITKNTVEMCNKIFLQNNLKTEDIVSIQFTLTSDLDEMNPCAALRQEDSVIKPSQVPLFCSQEAFVKNSLKQVIRVLITTYADKNTKPSHVYINGAEVLRPDLCK